MAGVPVTARPPAAFRGRISSTPAQVPALLLANSFEGGTPPSGAPLTFTSVTAGNSGGASGAAFDAVVTTNGTVVYDTAGVIHGAINCRCQATSAGANYVTWFKTLGVQPQIWFRLYCLLNSPPAQNLWLFSALQGSSLCARIGVSPGGLILAQNGNSTTVATTFSKIPAASTSPATPNLWFRLEGYVGGTTGIIAARLFNTPDSPVPTETLSVTGTATTGLIDHIRFGITAAAGAQGPLWLDDVAASNTGWLGPSSLVAEPSAGQPARVRVPPPSPLARGRAVGNAGAPVANPVAGVPFPALRQAVRASLPLPLKGRAGPGGRGAPQTVVVRATGIPVAQARRPQPSLPLRGRTASGRGAPTRNPGTGPAVTPLRGPVQAKPPLPPKGRTGGNRGAPLPGPTTGPAFPPLRRPVAAQIPRTWHGYGQHGSLGAARRNPVAGGVFPAHTSPVLARRPLPPAGRAASNVGAPVQNPPPPAPVSAPTGFYGLVVLTGPPAAVLSAILRNLPGVTGGRQRATFTTSVYTTTYADLPTLMTEVVWLC